jgi:hypothetical protein
LWPNGKHQTVYLLLNDFGQLSRAYCEASEDRSDLETTISDLISGQYDNPVRVIAFNAAERWSKTSRKKSHEKSCAALVLPVTSCRRRCYSITSSAATSSACGAGKLGCECIVHLVDVKMDGGQESKSARCDARGGGGAAHQKMPSLKLARHMYRPSAAKSDDGI